ncbi:unnamed protein product [Leuciscus chuanchicus]
MTLLRNRVIGGDILGSEALLFIRIPQLVLTEEPQGISKAADCMRGMHGLSLSLSHPHFLTYPAPTETPPLWVPGVVVGLWERYKRGVEEMHRALCHDRESGRIS